MKKTLFAGILFVIAVFLISGCSQQQTAEQAAQQTAQVKQEPVQQKQTATIKTQAEQYCGNAKCDSNEDCATCSLDCGKCRIQIFSAECYAKEGDYNIKITLKNTVSEFLSYTDVYPKAVFTDVGIFDGFTREISIEANSMKTYLYTFNTDYQQANEARITMIKGGATRISNEFTAECTDD